MNHDDEFAAALRALPLVKPPLDLWPELAARLPPRPQQRRRYAWPLALAASLLIGLLWSRVTLHDAALNSPTARLAGVVTSDYVLGALRARSQDLEGWLAALSMQSPRDGRSLMALAEIEDMVSLIDVQLSAARDEPEALPLWRQRVALLEDLAVIRSTPPALADGGANESVSL